MSCDPLIRFGPDVSRLHFNLGSDAYVKPFSITRIQFENLVRFLPRPRCRWDSCRRDRDAGRDGDYAAVADEYQIQRKFYPMHPQPQPFRRVVREQHPMIWAETLTKRQAAFAFDVIVRDLDDDETMSVHDDVTCRERRLSRDIRLPVRGEQRHRPADEQDEEDVTKGVAHINKVSSRA